MTGVGEWVDGWLVLVTTVAKYVDRASRTLSRYIVNDRNPIHSGYGPPFFNPPPGSWSTHVLANFEDDARDPCTVYLCVSYRWMAVLDDIIFIKKTWHLHYPSDLKMATYAVWMDVHKHSDDLYSTHIE